MQDGPRLWTVAAFGGEVALSTTGGGVQAGFVMRPEVAHALAQEIDRALCALR